MDGRIYQGVRGKMIEVKSSKGVVDLKASGEIKEILADLFVIVSSVYGAIAKEHPEKKDTLQTLIKGFFNSGMAFEEEDGEADD